MTRPHVVAFDLGKVLVDFDYRIAAHKIAARGTRPPAEVQPFLEQSPVLRRFETGRMTKEEFFQAACDATGFRGTLAEFSEYFADIFTPIAPMVEVQAALRARGVPTYVFSNTNDLAATHIRRAFPFMSNFDGYIYSYQCGAMKPDPKIYEALERLAGRRGPEILYLDDRRENTEAGRARSWQVIHHHAAEESLREIRRVGLL